MKLPRLLHRLIGRTGAGFPAFLLVAVGVGLIPLLLERVGRETAPSPSAQGTTEGPDPRQLSVQRAVALRRDGDYEQAAAIYAQLAREPGASGHLALAAAEAYSAAGSYTRALEMTDLAGTAEPIASQRLLLRAQALAKLGRAVEALEALDAYPSSAPLAGYAAFRAAEIRVGLGDEAGSRAAFARARAYPIAGAWRVASARRLGRSHGEASDYGGAVRWLERAAADARELEAPKAPVWFDGNLARLSLRDRRASILLELGEAQLAGAVGDAAATYAEIVTRYPSLSEARAALNRLAAMDAEGRVSDDSRGRVLYHAGEPRQALEAFGAFLAGGAITEEAAAQALFSMALALRDAGDAAGAREALVGLARASPWHPRAPEALWHAARLAETIGTRAEAIDAHLAIWTSFPADEYAGRALLRAGRLQLSSGDASGARETWERLGRLHPEPRLRAQGLFWLGRGLLGLGDAEGGSAALVEAAKLAPLAFEGIRARDLADGGLGAELFARDRATALARARPGSEECARWIEGWSGHVPSESGPGPQLARIDALLSVGMGTEALAEGLDLVAALADRPQDLYLVARGLEERSLYPVAIHAASRLAAANPEGDGDQAPGCVQRLMFPLAYREVVQQAAVRYRLDPYLFLALLRQESWFGPRALSAAQARGLSQVIPSTAAEIAREMGRTDFALDDLYRPRESVSFGAWYLGRQLTSFQRRPVLALAAYNGGPGNAHRWSHGNTAIDPDDFVEGIDYPETRSYVRSIYETYTRYRRLYD